MPLIIGTDADLPPPLIGTDVPGSAPGIPQPVIENGESLPPSFPLGQAGTWMPPPLVGEGGNVPFPTEVVPPAPVPPSIPGVVQPQFVPPGSATVPSAASLFPDGTTTPPYPPIVFANIFQIGTVPPPLPSTPGQNPPPIVPSPVPTIPQLPWPPAPAHPLPVNTVRPVISPPGAVYVSEQLTVSNGTWTDATTYARMWTRDGSPIDGVGNVLQYTLTTADLGALISCDITATGPGGSANMDAVPVGPVVNPTFPGNTVLPTVSGGTVVGDVLTRTTGTWTGIPTPTLTTQWQRNGTAIAGATAATYTTVVADEGAMIGVAVTAANIVADITENSNTVGPITATVARAAPAAPAQHHRAPPKKKR